MTEKTPGQCFYEAMYADDGGVWSGVDERHRPLWEAKAQAFLSTRPQSDLTREGVEAAVVAILDTFHDGQREKKARVIADAILAMVPGGVPDGWKLVPVEPTEAMLDVWWDALGKGFTFKGVTIRGVYRAMLSAAPLPAAPTEADHG